MPNYRVETLEKFTAIATYHVNAPNPDKAIEEIIKGKVAYDYHEHPGDDDEFIEVLEIEED